MYTVGDVITYIDGRDGNREGPDLESANSGRFLGKQFIILQIENVHLLVRDVQTGEFYHFYKWRFGEVNPQSKLKATIQRIEKRHLCLK